MIKIYKITNTLNGKVYIGQSLDVHKRWQQYIGTASNSLIHKSIKKYGKENFLFEIIDEAENFYDADSKEKFYIEKYNSFGSNGYNLTRSGQEGRVYSNEIIDNIIDYLLKIENCGNYKSEEVAKIFDCSPRLIRGINSGEYYRKNNLSYPLIKRVYSKTYCIDCGKEISHGCKRCKECNYISARVVKRPSKETLKKEIETNTYVALGKKYGVSGNAVRKWAKRYGLR